MARYRVHARGRLRSFELLVDLHHHRAVALRREPRADSTKSGEPRHRVAAGVEADAPAAGVRALRHQGRRGGRGTLREGPLPAERLLAHRRRTGPRHRRGRRMPCARRNPRPHGRQMTEMSRESRGSLRELSRYLAIARQLLVAVVGRLDRKLSTGAAGRRMLIVGAGAAGESVVRDMASNPGHGYRPIGFVDDDRATVGRRIRGIRVLGTRADLPRVPARYKPDEVLVAMPAADASQIRSILRALRPFGLPIKTLPALRDLVDGNVRIAHIRSLAVEDLLARSPVCLDSRSLKQLIDGRRVMVTSAAAGPSR